MTEETKEPKPELTDFDRAAVELAYEIISRYVDHTQIAGLVIGTMAARLGEEGVKPIAQSEYWQGYMASRRQLQEAKDDIERLSRLLDSTR
jgi:uncharacterized membrane-anchored protein YhcB (DUF1043 family)